MRGHTRLSRTSSRPRRPRPIRWRLLLPLLLAAVFNQTTSLIVRLGSTYEAIALSMTGLQIGLIAAAFALVPLLAALVLIPLRAGSGTSVLTGLAGGGLMTASVVLLWVSDATFWVLVAVNGLLGIGSSTSLVSLQLATTRCSGPSRRATVLSNFSVAVAIGQALGPLFIGLLGGDHLSQGASSALYGVAAISALGVIVASAAMLRVVPASRPPGRDDAGGGGRFLDAGLWVVILVSVVSLTSSEILIIYLPMLGVERGLAVGIVSTLLTIRAVAVIGSRMMYPALSARFSTRNILIFAMSVSSMATAGLAIEGPLAVMIGLMVVSGLGFGLSAIGSLALILEVARPAQRSNALLLRISSNRIGQFVMPIAMGLAVTALGVGFAFAVMASAQAGMAAVLRVRGAR